METVTRNFPMIFLCIPDSLKDRADCIGLTLLQTVMNMGQKCYKIYVKPLESNKRWWKPDRINLQRGKERCKISTNWSMDSMQFQSTPQQFFFCRNRLVSSKVYMEMPKPWNSQTSFIRDKDEGLPLSDFIKSYNFQDSMVLASGQT